MSNLQKNLAPFDKTRSLPEEMHLRTDNKHQPKHVCTKDDFQKSELNQLLCNLFNADGQIPPDCKYGTAYLNKVKKTENKSQETLTKLDVKKACGTDNIGKTASSTGLKSSNESNSATFTQKSNNKLLTDNMVFAINARQFYNSRCISTTSIRTAIKLNQTNCLSFILTSKKLLTKLPIANKSINSRRLVSAENCYNC